MSSNLGFRFESEVRIDWREEFRRTRVWFVIALPIALCLALLVKDALA